MVVKRAGSAQFKGPEGPEGEAGQSLLEFLLTLPMLVALVVILVRVNSVIQVSIVNQQYARAQALFLAYNSSEFPSIDRRMSQLVAKRYSQMVLGVADNAAPRQGGYVPKAAAQNVARKKIAEGDDAEGDLRALVRVRDTVTLCTQANFVNGGAPLPIYGGPPFAEAARLQYCGTPMPYLSGDDS